MNKLYVIEFGDEILKKILPELSDLKNISSLSTKEIYIIFMAYVKYKKFNQTIIESLFKELSERNTRLPKDPDILLPLNNHGEQTHKNDGEAQMLK